MKCRNTSMKTYTSSIETTMLVNIMVLTSNARGIRTRTKHKPPGSDSGTEYPFNVLKNNITATHGL